MTQEQLLSSTFAELAQTLTTEFEPVDLLHILADRTLDLLNVDAVGLMLTDQRGHLQVMAATSYETRVLELFELQNAEGPCYDCFHSGQQVVNVNVEEVEDRWPSFSRECRQAGFASVHALPLRLRHQIIGAMNLFSARNMTLSDADVSVGQSLADVATIGLLHGGPDRRHDVVSEQLQEVTNARITLDEAKSAVAKQTGIDDDQALRRLRDYAESRTLPLTHVATSVLNGTISVHDLQPDRSEG